MVTLSQDGMCLERDRHQNSYEPTVTRLYGLGLISRNSSLTKSSSLPAIVAILEERYGLKQGAFSRARREIKKMVADRQKNTGTPMDRTVRFSCNRS